MAISHLYLRPSCKDLDVILDSHLSFNDHIDYLSPSLLGKLRQINRVLHLFTKDVLLVILDFFVFCKLFYCSTVWLGTTQANIRKLHLLQNTQSMAISHHPSMKLVGFPQMKCYSSDVNMVCKCLHGLAPNYLETKLVKRFYTHCYTTQMNSIKITFKRTSTAQTSFFDHSISLWNDLGNYIKSSSNVISFKRFTRRELWACL